MIPEFINPPCPFLPEIENVIPASEVVRLGKERGPVFYETSLRYGQSRWRIGFPAQALLQVNRALSTWFAHDEPVLHRWPLPYKVVSWLAVNRPEGQFFGNPRRHFQHLATRMVEPNKELRVWRAWACWYLAKAVLPEAEFPADTKQIREEGIVEPAFAQIRERLLALSPADDEARWREALEWSKPWHLRQASAAELHIEPVGVEGLPVVRDLAYAIWPRVYPGIISMEQIDYMLARRYDLAVLEADVRRGVRHALLKTGGEAVGYVAFEPLPGKGEAFLHKLYLLPETAGVGLGSAALQWVAEQARALGLDRVRLCVNKHNAGAIRAYRRNGFEFFEDVVTDIGGGFVMDDHVMVKEV